MRHYKRNRAQKQETQICRDVKCKEYEDFIRMTENVGVADLLRLYTEYKKLLDISSKYMQEMYPRFAFSTTDSSV